MQEKWKPINGYENLYSISNYGRVRSFSRVVKCGNGYKTTKTKVLRPMINSTGYYRVQLVNENSERRRLFIHRLVAEHFIANPNNYDTVNHKDFNPTNNTSSNLEWTTRAGNMNYSGQNGRFKKHLQWRNNIKAGLEKSLGKPIVATSTTCETQIVYLCLNDCAKDGFSPSCVSNCCNGKRRHHKGYTWKFLIKARADEVSPN